ncbi:uncharacterized protein [Parasteatoda tepidariorum]|uniref:uncharacterized protein n=1 Tax=Parasteatoda tepidariorum TaxID=114398 RepID=UPI00077F9BA4|nr:uncharacterized protein LOC107449740 [Parasteatoda tepidariorum]
MVIFTCIFVCLTVILSGVSTLFLTFSLLSDEWEFLTYEKASIEEMAKLKNHSLQWLSGDVGKLFMPELTITQNISGSVAYLVPARGGVNNLCPDLPDSVKSTMEEDGFVLKTCISYLSNDDITSRDTWLDRMRNLAMSCAMVSLILLAFSTPLGLLGLYKKQISTIMVNGVMYILAGVFGTFNLAFMHFKRAKPADGFYTSTILDKNLPEDYMKARIFTVGWPPSAEWAGLIVCMIGSLFWLLLAKIYRLQILNPT